jgi:hypothetical protein
MPYILNSASFQSRLLLKRHCTSYLIDLIIPRLLAHHHHPNFRTCTHYLDVSNSQATSLPYGLHSTSKLSWEAFPLLQIYVSRSGVRIWLSSTSPIPRKAEKLHFQLKSESSNSTWSITQGQNSKYQREPKATCWKLWGWIFLWLPSLALQVLWHVRCSTSFEAWSTGSRIKFEPRTTEYFCTAGNRLLCFARYLFHFFESTTEICRVYGLCCARVYLSTRGVHAHIQRSVRIPSSREVGWKWEERISIVSCRRAVAIALFLEQIR